MSLIRICGGSDFTADYDKDRGMYRVSVFNDNHFTDEYCFYAYEEKEVENLYVVYGTINEHMDIDTWVEDIFDNAEQALACAEYLNATKKQDNVIYYAPNRAWHLNKLNYVEMLKKLKE